MFTGGKCDYAGGGKKKDRAGTAGDHHRRSSMNYVRNLQKKLAHTNSIHPERAGCQAGLLLKCTDAVDSGKSYYILLMSVIKSKPSTLGGW